MGNPLSGKKSLTIQRGTIPLQAKHAQGSEAATKANDNFSSRALGVRAGDKGDRQKTLVKKQELTTLQ